MKYIYDDLDRYPYLIENTMNHMRRLEEDQPELMNRYHPTDLFKIGKFYLVWKKYPEAKDSFLKALDYKLRYHEENKYQFVPDYPRHFKLHLKLEEYLDISFFSGEILAQIEKIDAIAFPPTKESHTYSYAVNKGICSVLMTKKIDKRYINLIYDFENGYPIGSEIRFEGVGVGDTFQGMVDNNIDLMKKGIEALLNRFNRVQKKNRFIPVCEIACNLYSILQIKKMGLDIKDINKKHQRFIPDYFNQLYK